MSLSPEVDVVEQTVDNSPDATASDRQRVMWEVFRDEHFEGNHLTALAFPLIDTIAAVEQLPLTIHRQYSLLRELDDRTECRQLLSTVYCFWTSMV